MKIRYYISRNKIENLYCRLTEGNNKVIFSLRYAVDPKNWSAYNERMRTDHLYGGALRDLRHYLAHRYQELKAEGEEDILEILKNEVNSFTKDLGIQGIARKMFDYKYEKIGVPSYDDFFLAFEKYTGLTKKDYRARTSGSQIVFYTDDKVYLMDTYEGKTAVLKSMFARKSFIDIGCTPTEFWRHIFDNRPISKTLLSEVLIEWVEYWERRFQEALESGEKLSSYEKMKENSWKKFEKFKKKYNQETNPFLALGCQFLLHGIVMYVWVKFSDADEIFSEYCHYQFSNAIGWESVFLENGHSSTSQFQITSSSSYRTGTTTGRL